MSTYIPWSPSVTIHEVSRENGEAINFEEAVRRNDTIRRALPKNLEFQQPDPEMARVDFSTS